MSKKYFKNFGLKSKNTARDPVFDVGFYQIVILKAELRFLWKCEN